MGVFGRLRQTAGEWILPLLPRGVRERIVGPLFSWNHWDLRPVARLRSGETRLLIAPANSASQAVLWARAAETLPGVKARTLVFGHNPSGPSVAPDVSVKPNVGRNSPLWSRRQRRAILQGFTHVIYEAERAILPALFGEDLEAEIKDLQEHGVRVAMLSHGSDVRLPLQHRESRPYSPFHTDLEGLTAKLEEVTEENVALLGRLEVPKLVSTLDLLEYIPNADWLPTLVDRTCWQGLPPAQLGERKLVVLHVPSRSALKGTSQIRSAMERLQEQGLIDYVEAQGVPASEMPKLVGQADLVVDQLGMDLYGVASVEAMCAGRLVAAQVGDFIREQTRNRCGLDVPIIEANPDTIYEVVKDVATHPSGYAHLVDEGRRFVEAVHSEDKAAAALAQFLDS